MVDTSGEVDAIGKNIFLFNSKRCGVFLYEFRQVAERVLGPFQYERYIFFIINKFALEVCHCDADVVSADVRSHEIAGSLIEPVDARAPSSRSSCLSEVLEKSVFNQFSNESCDCRDAGVEFLAEFRYAEISVINTKPENLLLHNGTLALYVVEKSRHIFYV